MAQLKWRSIALDAREVQLATVLRCGQSFRWKQIDNVFSMAYKGRVVFLKQTPEHVEYASIPDDSELKVSTREVVSDYLNLDVKLAELYDSWGRADTKFLTKARDFGGIRILRQDPWECLCSFICSTNNNIKRISSMVENLCVTYGPLVAHHDGIDYYDFPTPASLAKPEVETKLRSLAFGYRAKYIQQTASLVDSLGADYLQTLRIAPYSEAHEGLLQFTGVGPKVADCVCLMSLDKHDCVPVDTHVWQIAQRDYRFGTKYKTLNKQAYEAIGQFFRNRWGPYAGWAQSVLFTADLRDLNNGLNKTTDSTDSVSIPEIKVKRELKLEDELPSKRINLDSAERIKVEA